MDTWFAINKTRLTRPTRSFTAACTAALCPSFPLGKTPGGPGSTNHPTYPPPPPGCHLNLSRPQPSLSLGHCFVAPRKLQARKHLAQLALSLARRADTSIAPEYSLDIKHARRGELFWALSQSRLSSIEPLFPHVERTSVKVCRNPTQRPPASVTNLFSSRTIGHPRLGRCHCLMENCLAVDGRGLSLRLAV